jgi:hypothetical protein
VYNSSRCRVFVHLVFGVVQSQNHLFRQCHFAWKIWREIESWYGLSSVSLENSLSHFGAFLFMLSLGMKGKTSVLKIWHVVMWVLWRARNYQIYSNKHLILEDVVEGIKGVTWKWLLAKMSQRSPCLFYE